ncbi:MAG: hypothetical protein WBZ51_30705, partial [Xanthobacteraceae bacterium]
LNPQLLKGPKYSTAGWALAGLYGSRAFSRHRRSIYRHLPASRSSLVLQGVPLVARERREVHVYGFGDGTGSHKGLVRGRAFCDQRSSALGTNQDNYTSVTQLAQAAGQLRLSACPQLAKADVRLRS